MKNTRALIVVLAFATVMTACKKSESDENTTSEQTASISKPANAVAEKKSNTENRKFLRTAGLKFKAKDVAKTTYQIENITTKWRGFVAFTNLQSNSKSEQTAKFNADSSVVTTRFNVENEMVIRIPNENLDATLKDITPLIEHLDFRVIKSDDVSLKLLSNNMAQNRAEEHANRLANDIDGKGKKLIDITNAEDILNAKKEVSDNAEIENLSLNDQVNFSTINISMYQNESVSHEMIANVDNGKYSQSIASRFADSLQTGWNMIMGLLIFFTQLWGLLLIALILFLGYKKYKLAFNK